MTPPRGHADQEFPNNVSQIPRDARTHSAAHLPSTRPPDPSFEYPVPSWTGRLTLEVFDGECHRAGEIDVVIRIDNVTLWSGNRTLAVIDRDVLRRWREHPWSPLDVDDVILSLVGTNTCLTVDRRHDLDFRLDDDQVASLMQVL